MDDQKDKFFQESKTSKSDNRLLTILFIIALFVAAIHIAKDNSYPEPTFNECDYSGCGD